MKRLKNTKNVLVVSLIILLAFFMTGCDSVIPEQAVTDQCLRRELFKECMASLPAGPDNTVYSDWDEVVEECGMRAYYQSQRMKAFVKPECRNSAR